jgi:hypothetical protein
MDIKILEYVRNGRVETTQSGFDGVHCVRTPLFRRGAVAGESRFGYPVERIFRIPEGAHTKDRA